MLYITYYGSTMYWTKSSSCLFLKKKMNYDNMNKSCAGNVLKNSHTEYWASRWGVEGMLHSPYDTVKAVDVPDCP